jgi:hypothetical protein
LFQVFSALHISIHNLFKPSFHQGFLFLHFLKSAYSNLLNQQYSITDETELATNKNRSDTFNDFILTETISVIEKAEKGKSAGYDDLPAEVFINNGSALFLHH